jgi:hypothetical protein
LPTPPITASTPKDSSPAFIKPIGINPDDYHQRLSESDFVVLGQSDKSYQSSYNGDEKGGGVGVVASVIASANKLSDDNGDGDEKLGTDNIAIALHSRRFVKQEGDFTEEEEDEISVSSSMAAVEFDEHDASDEGFYDNDDVDASDDDVDEDNYYRGSSDNRNRTPSYNNRSGGGGGDAPYWKSMSKGNNYYQQDQVKHQAQNHHHRRESDTRRQLV